MGLCEWVGPDGICMCMCKYMCVCMFEYVCVCIYILCTSYTYRECSKVHWSKSACKSVRHAH